MEAAREVRVSGICQAGGDRSATVSIAPVPGGSCFFGERLASRRLCGFFSMADNGLLPRCAGGAVAVTRRSVPGLATASARRSGFFLRPVDPRGLSPCTIRSAPGTRPQRATRRVERGRTQAGQTSGWQPGFSQKMSVAAMSVAAGVLGVATCGRGEKGGSCPRNDRGVSAVGF